MIFEELAEFTKDVKHLSKRFRSLDQDLEVVKKVINYSPDARPPFSFQINNLQLDTCVIKVKKIACKSLKGKGVNSGLRLIYAYFKQVDKIVFIEIFYKSDKENEDRERILKYFT
jgi:mRNA-degrading endonuclease YafQ of YafQ-DinJ toxin-antitoxin module